MIIITGGAGFIGSAFLSHLNSIGVDEVIIVDNLHSGEKWKNLNSKVFLDLWTKEDFLHKIESGKLPPKAKNIVHLGACSSTLEKDVDYLVKNNFHYSISVAKYCLEKNIRLVYASSAATYGDGKQGFSDLGDISKLAPLNPYGFSKQIFDLWAERNGLLKKAVGIKFFNVFGPNEYHKGNQQSMVLKGYQQISSCGEIKLFRSNTQQFADGEQLRDFIYVKDCCEVIQWFVENKKVAGLFNLGTGKARSWNDLAKSIFSALNLPARIEYINMPEGMAKQYQNFTEAEVSKLREAGYTKPFSTLEDSISDYVGSYLSQELSYF